ncbi:MAG: DUF2304 domain-containing protein [Bdellovibrionales bacterium]|nr:DUF2304 domain-containing protein [Bdellovibrionales bacterium]
MMSLNSRIISVLVGISIFVVVSFLIRRRRMYNIYAASWLIMGTIFLGLGFFSDLIPLVVAITGVQFGPAAILVVVLGAVLTNLLHLSVIVSSQHIEIKRLEKEISLLRKLN